MRNSKSYVTAFKQNKLIKPKKNELSPNNFGSTSSKEKFSDENMFSRKIFKV